MSDIASKNYKCPCCNNPWAAATSELFAKLCADCEIQQPTKDVGLNPENMDTSVKPWDNFYEYANGNWMKNNPIPAGYPSWNSFLMLHVQSQERLKTLLEELYNNLGGESVHLTENQRKVAQFYATAMDEEAIEKQGIQPLKPLLAVCEEAAAVDNLGSYLGSLHANYGIRPFFSIGASPDYTNSVWSILQISQGGLGLPDRDYYFDDDKEEKRELYKKHISNMFQLIGEEENLSEAIAVQIYDIEVKLAESHMTKTECRDPLATYNKMSTTELLSNDKFDLAVFLENATNKSIHDVSGDYFNVRNPAAIEKAAQVISSLSGKQSLVYYLKWNILRSFAPYLANDFVMENFDFYEKTLSGTTEIKPRWKRSIAFTESVLGEALGELYCQKYFDENSKEKALEIVENVRKALEDRLKEVEWMTDEATREAALLKMSRFKVKIGYPDKWIDYSTLKIDSSDTLLSMILASNVFDHNRTVKKMNAPTDKDEWFMTPQTVNAYYHPSLNEIVFPAAILQHPFFDANADDAVNYGAMGAVVGHEMTHGFDDKGRKFNHEGNMEDWWTEADGEEYTKRVDVMIQQANKFEVYGQSVKGELTCGENIADLGGLRLALRALKAQPNFSNTTPLVSNFTPTQRFFLSWAQCWRQNVTKERALQLITLDPHGPNEMRCNGPLSNMAEFHEAFEIQEDEKLPMFRCIQDRVDIW